MTSNYLWTLQPTFTQGLILGQISILLLLGLVLKYLFLDSTQTPFETSSYHAHIDNDTPSVPPFQFKLEKDHPDYESAEWLNMLMQQLLDVYRARLRGHKSGTEGDEIARRHVEQFANKIRPSNFIGHVKITSVDLGSSTPRLYNGRSRNKDSSIVFDVEYTDSVSVSLSTSYLFNYPMPSFARLPISLTVTLSLFKSSMTISPPSQDSSSPALSISLSKAFSLHLSTTSLMGSRAKLANVPKLHELIEVQLGRVLASKGEWKFYLPHLTTPLETQRKTTQLTEEITIGAINSTC